MSDDIVLQARGLTRKFNDFTAVKDVDLDIRRGSIHGLIGPNGAGKTTCFNLLTKFLTPTAGTILLDGEDVTQSDPASIALAGMARSFQISAVFMHMSVLENVRLALQRSQVNSYAFWRKDSTLQRLDERATELIESVGLLRWRDGSAAELSYGRKRALELATTLALNPRVMLLDEPMAGMGHEDIDRITDLIKRISVGRTVVMVEHNLKVVANLCQTITVLRRGEKLAEGDYAYVSNHPGVIEAYMGASDV